MATTNKNSDATNPDTISTSTSVAMSTISKTETTPSNSNSNSMTSDGSSGANSNENNDVDLSSWEFGSYICLILSLTLPLILITIGKIYHSRDRFIGCDSPNYIAIFLCFWNIGDLYSDLMFCMILLFENNKLFYFCLLFILFPYILSCIMAMYLIRKWQKLRVGKNRQLKKGIVYGGAKYVDHYDWVIISTTVVAGFYTAIELVRSKLFYKPMFSLQMKKAEYSRIQSMRFFTTVLFELSIFCLYLYLYLYFGLHLGA